MDANSLQARWMGLLLALALLSAGCASLKQPSGRGTSLNYTPGNEALLASAEEPNGELLSPLTSHPSSPGETDALQRLHHRRGAQKTLTEADVRYPLEGAVPLGAAEPAQQGATEAHRAFLAALLEVSGATRRLSEEISRLKASRSGITGKHSILFLPYVEFGDTQLQWIDGELSAASRLSLAAMNVEVPELQLALLRMAGPRLEATLLGSLLLAAWVDFLNLTDVVLQKCPGYSLERLVRLWDGLRKLLAPTMTALAALEQEQMEAAADDLPALMGYLTREFAATREDARASAENFEKILLFKEAIDTLTTLSAMKMALPRLLRLAAPAALGVSLEMGSGGVMMGTQVVVSAEWMEMMRRLVQAGVLSVPVVSAAVRTQAGQVLMTEAHDELPRGVREALGEGPEVRGMRVTGRTGAGMAEPPRHHVLPREHREWFERRGFRGEMDIDQFCIRLEQAKHEAIHGGGNWRLGRMWPGEWNRMIMKALQKAETRTGRMLTPSEILKVVANYMKEYDIPISFSPWRGK